MGKEKSIVELRDEKRQLRAASQELINKAREEKRAISADESSQIDQNNLRMREIDLEIEERKDQLADQRNREGQRESRSFSLVRAIRAQMNGSEQEDAEKSVISRAVVDKGLETVGNLQVPFSAREHRDGNLTAAAGATYGGVTTEDREFVLPLENNLVLAQAGAQVLTGLRGNLRFPGSTDVAVAWEDENGEADDGTPTISTAASLSPKRLAAIVKISKQLLIQENQDVEGYVRRLISIAVAQKLESTILGKGNTGLTGMFYTSPGIKDTFSWVNVVAMETAVNSAGGLHDKLAYIIHPNHWGKAKTTAKEGTTGAGGLIINSGDSLLNGYPVFNTANLASDVEISAAVGSTPAVTGPGAVFGNFSDMVVGNWGNLDITVDPFTLSGYGQVRLVVNTYWAYALLHSGSFKTAALKLS